MRSYQPQGGEALQFICTQHIETHGGMVSSLFLSLIKFLIVGSNYASALLVFLLLVITCCNLLPGFQDDLV